MVSQRISLEILQREYGGYFNSENSLFVDTERDMKHVYSSLNHASLFYSKFFTDSLSTLLVKFFVERTEKLELAK